MSVPLTPSLPSLTVVTVCWNDLAGLRATVESIDDQSRQPDQHLIVDGASTDGTPEWLAALPGRPWRSFSTEPDRGIYDAMNKGLSRASGDYVLFMNSGDRLMDGEVIRDVLTALGETRPSWAFGKSWIEWPTRPGFHDLGPSGRQAFFTGRATVPHQAVFVSKELVERIGMFRPEVGLSADQELLMRAWVVAEPQYLDRAIARCDATGVGSTQRPWSLAIQMFRHRRRNRVPKYSWGMVNVGLLLAGSITSTARATARALLRRKR